MEPFMAQNKINYVELKGGAFVATEIPVARFNSSSGIDWVMPRNADGSFTTHESIFMFHNLERENTFEEIDGPVTFALNDTNNQDIYSRRVASNCKLVESMSTTADVRTPTKFGIAALAINRNTGQWCYLGSDGSQGTVRANAVEAVITDIDFPATLVMATQAPGTVHEFNYTVPAGWDIVGFHSYFEYVGDLPPGIKPAIAGFWLYGTSSYVYDPSTDKAQLFSEFNPEMPFS